MTIISQTPHLRLLAINFTFIMTDYTPQMDKALRKACYHKGHDKSIVTRRVIFQRLIREQADFVFVNATSKASLTRMNFHHDQERDGLLNFINTHESKVVWLQNRPGANHFETILLDSRFCNHAVLIQDKWIRTYSRAPVQLFYLFKSASQLDNLLANANHMINLMSV
jgi:hypothetical protein